ncbi:MAG: hypothetical protein CMI60_21580 [Parvibaculum sp.]|nr:hypothetical protein [Parvibaculum sp.]
MIKRENFPICAKSTCVAMQWTSNGVNNLELISAHLTFDNINVTTAGDIQKGRTSLPFDNEEPIQWSEGTSQAIKDAFSNPKEALSFALLELYESDEHQYILGTKVKPV